ncbi:lymphocyte cytosolic protein 2-like [Latimeria chalumnae]|uniref:lymphocyte cytosolic protein 2-like n=1 Tax=Latimeria chalumnae TaxID=7897 RepID=UPI00313EEB75
MPVPNPDSLSPSASLPARFQQGVNINRSFSKGPTDNRPLFPPQNKRPIPPAPAEEECSLDEAWYVPDYNRTEAESALRSLNQDGAFLVRDSSRRTVTQPYVLMVLYRNKVYNIQIRFQEELNTYSLGTGLKGKESFTSVAEIIDHYKRNPLLLIDGKDKGSGQRSQCTLRHPAGYC